MITVPIMASTESEALRNMACAARVADLIEIRLDLLPRTVWPSLLRRGEKPSIVTLRPARQGGHFKGEERLRARLLQEALRHHPAFLDLEWDTPPELMGAILRERGDKTRLIVSFHNTEETPTDLERITKDVISLGGDITKVVTHANCFTDNLRILSVIERHGKKIIAFCMGPLGVPSRILTLRAGGYMTFGSLGLGRESAPGQIPASDLREIYRVHKMGSQTRLFGLVGNPVSHSLSPAMLNAAFESEDQNAVYVPLQMHHLENLIRDFESIGVEGFSVTIPHKEQIVSLLDGIDEAAQAMRAVNTVYRQNGRWLGINTDVSGILNALGTSTIDFQGKQWTILGAGGVARAVAYAAAVHARPKAVTTLGRSRPRLQGFLDDMREVCPFPITGALLSATDLKGVLDKTDVLVNCTPVGMSPRVDETPVPSDLLRRGQVVFDTVYTPIETRLLREARQHGCLTISGFQMFLHQGAAQFERWTGRSAPLTLMEQKARERLSN